MTDTHKDGIDNMAKNLLPVEGIWRRISKLSLDAKAESKTLIDRDS